MSNSRLYRKPSPGYTTVEIDLEPEIIDILESMARERGITVDEIVEEALQLYIDEHRELSDIV